MEFVSVEVEQVIVKGAVGSNGSGSANSEGTSSSSGVVNKRRKVEVRSGNGGECGDVSADSACVVRCGRFEGVTGEVNFPEAAENCGALVVAKEHGERCLSGDVEDPTTASCCSSNESVDLEVKSREVDESTIQSSSKRETMPRGEAVGTESDVNEGNNPPAVVVETASGNSPRRQFPARMPSKSEIDDFFSSAEKKAALQFKEKYNFDFEKEEPLRGRYDWKPFTAVAASAPGK